MVRGALSSMPGQDVTKDGISVSGTKGLVNASDSSEGSSASSNTPSRIMLVVSTSSGVSGVIEGLK
jgi:hypothetical protein